MKPTAGHGPQQEGARTLEVFGVDVCSPEGAMTRFLASPARPGMYHGPTVELAPLYALAQLSEDATGWMYLVERQRVAKARRASGRLRAARGLPDADRV